MEKKKKERRSILQFVVAVHINIFFSLLMIVKSPRGINIHLQMNEAQASLILSLFLCQIFHFILTEEKKNVNIQDSCK